MSGTLTSATTVITMSQATLFPTPVQLQGFAADDVFDTDQIKDIEAVMGVDGVLSFGFMFVPIMQNYTLQANSDSITDFFDVIYAQQQAAKDVYPVDGTVLIPALNKKYNMFNGALTGYSPTPSAKRFVQPQRFQMTWNSIVPSRIN